MATIDYFLSTISPYAYLGHRAFLDVARDAGAEVRFRPVRIFELFEANGGLPLGKRAPARQRYRLHELQRWRAVRGVPLNLAPKHFPTDPGLADRCAIAIVEDRGDPSDFLEAAFRAIWAEDRDIADEAVVSDVLQATGFDAGTVLRAAGAPAIEAILEANTAAAIAADLPGLPGYVLNGEPFWGQDRVDMLADALASGRPPFRSP